MRPEGGTTRKAGSRPGAALLAAALLAGVALSAAGCSASDDGGAVRITGSVEVPQVVLSVPRLSPEPTSTPDPGWSRVRSVSVRSGDRVEAGDEIASLEAAESSAAVREARAGLAEARARRALVDEKLSDVEDARGELADSREELRDMLAGARKQRADVADRLEQARELAERMRSQPPSPPPGQAPPGAVPPNGTPGGAPPGTAPPSAVPPGASQGAVQDPQSIVAQLSGALARIDDGIARAEDGLRKLDDAEADLGDARQALEAVADAADAGVDAAEAGVRLAEVRAGLATVRAPVAGIVLEPPVLGEVLAADAPLARLRPDGPARVTTYLTAQQARRVRSGDRAEVRGDSLSGTLDARVERVADEYEYVPTRFATREIHLLRGFEAVIRLDEGTSAPPGTPVDLTIVAGRR